MILLVLKHPDAQTLATIQQYEDAMAPAIPPGWEAMTEIEFANWRAAEIANGWKPAAVAEPVPDVISPAQLRLVMLKHGIDSTRVDALTANDPAARVRWEYSTEIHRGSPLVAQFAAALGLDAAMVDAMFIEAATL